MITRISPFGPLLGLSGWDLGHLSGRGGNASIKTSWLPPPERLTITRALLANNISFLAIHFVIKVKWYLLINIP